MCKWKWRSAKRTQVLADPHENDSTADDGEISGRRKSNGDESKVQSQVRGGLR